MEKLTFLFILLSLTTLSSTAVVADTIAFASVGRSRYNFDIFSVPLSSPNSSSEFQLTDGVSVNYNGFFVDNSTSLLYVSERDGVSNIILDINHLSLRRQFPLLHSIPLKDRPSLIGDHLIHVSTHEESGVPRQSWAAVYSTHLPTKQSTRLTPIGVADFSPSVSPSGEWTAVASFVEWHGEVDELKTDIYIFRTADGSSRTRVVEHGGWPCWADDSTIYFHRRGSDSWWSVYRVRLADGVVERVTPPGFHVFTPATATHAPGIIAVATRRPDSEYRHIEVFNVETEEFVAVTTANAHHYNPFLSADGMNIGYHRCRGAYGNGSPPVLLEKLKTPLQDAVSVFRADGDFPSFSHDGTRMAFVRLPGVFVANADGSGAEMISDSYSFATAWDWKKKDLIYTSTGPVFASEKKEVNIVAINTTSGTVKELTRGSGNNAFPSPSPDGKSIVFRSGRSGHKNLYIMDAEEGDEGGIYQLTNGPWSDTMANWSPDGEWIAFSSDRHNPGNGSFKIYAVRPDGTGLHKVFESADKGRANHPWFSPDSKSLVFTSDYAGVNAEPIAIPHQYQPYGDIFVMNFDGSELRRLTYNAYEDGTPSWGRGKFASADVPENLEKGKYCEFNDCHFLSIAAGVGAAGILGATC